MSAIDISAFEQLDLADWTLVKEETNLKVYQQGSMEKRLQYYEIYSLEAHFSQEKAHGITIGRMNAPFFHYPDRQSKIYLIEHYVEGKQEGISLSFYEDGAKTETY